MNGNNSKTLVWDNIPEWAIFALEYGTREELFLSVGQRIFLIFYLYMKVVLSSLLHLLLLHLKHLFLFHDVNFHRLYLFLA